MTAIFRWHVLLAAVAAISLLGAADAGGVATAAPRLRHVVVVVFENHEEDSIIGSADAPTFTSLARAYARATDYTAVTHPSLPNYLALVSGSTHGVTNDCTTCAQHGPTIGSQLSDRGQSWAAYAEGYPSAPRFAKKHVPFLYFRRDATHVKPLTALDPSRLPTFSFVVPDLCHDMHDCSVSTGDAWLRTFIHPLLALKSTAVFIAFDEGTSTIGGGGKVALIVAGSAVKPHSAYHAHVTHYGLLHTVEALLGLPPIGHAAAAPVLTGIWARSP
ncbi:MAG TPA: alkaline phosphatase family protein [Gaiellaceae bacterium]|jgi:acid phosphatase